MSIYKDDIQNHKQFIFLHFALLFSKGKPIYLLRFLKYKSEHFFLFTTEQECSDVRIKNSYVPGLSLFQGYNDDQKGVHTQTGSV